MRKDAGAAAAAEIINMQKLQVRKLEIKEHSRTRKLWEEIFVSDTSEFLDYYYAVKAKDNEIYVIEDEGEIVSMLHLNPYKMRVWGKEYQTHYIVAVATDVRYRRRGMMATLMNHCLRVMKERKEPFTFLMPASEALYRPFGFEFIYNQGQGSVRGESIVDSEVDFVLATWEDCEEMAYFANRLLSHYDVTVLRSASYYQMMLAEQESENGGILLARKNGALAGIFCFAKEGHVEIREPLFEEEILLRNAAYHLTGSESEEVRCIGYGSEKKPVIMAKVLCPELSGDLRHAKVFLNEVV